MASLLGLIVSRPMGLRSHHRGGRDPQPRHRRRPSRALRGLQGDRPVRGPRGHRAHAALVDRLRRVAGPGAPPGRLHSVSSFNNAGFALFSDNLIGFAGDPLILMPIAPVVVAGSLGVPVMMELRRELRPRKWRLHTS